MNSRHDDFSAGATTIATSEEKSPPTVLVVDDTKEIRELIASCLRRRGYLVLEAEDGLAAQMILHTEHPALVISDLEMPVSDGWDVLAFCHAHQPGLPVLIVSGATMGRHPDAERWAAGVLPKPFDLVRLHAEVERLVSHAA